MLQVSFNRVSVFRIEFYIGNYQSNVINCIFFLNFVINGLTKYRNNLNIRKQHIGGGRR